jgi:hypothetical protein
MPVKTCLAVSKRHVNLKKILKQNTNRKIIYKIPATIINNKKKKRRSKQKQPKFDFFIFNCNIKLRRQKLKWILIYQLSCFFLILPELSAVLIKYQRFWKERWEFSDKPEWSNLTSKLFFFFFLKNYFFNTLSGLLKSSDFSESMQLY